MRPSFTDAQVRVQVPATSANLGPGFDALALALSRHDEMTARVAGTGLSIGVEGEGADLRRDESHLVVRAMRTTFARLGGQPPGLELACINRVPHARGLGSSAAAIVAGVLMARELVLDGRERLSDADLLALASEIEGHPDNVAACLLGGLTIAWNDPVARAIRVVCDPQVQPVVVIPPFEASTAHARGLLPATVPHSDAAFAAGRAALLVAALTGATDVLLAATEDRLHQSYRASAMPESAALVARLRADGHAAVISGAGPTVLVLARDGAQAQEVTQDVPDGWEATVMAVDALGAQIAQAAQAAQP